MPKYITTFAKRNLSNISSISLIGSGDYLTLKIITNGEHDLYGELAIKISGAVNTIFNGTFNCKAISSTLITCEKVLNTLGNGEHNINLNLSGVTVSIDNLFLDVELTETTSGSVQYSIPSNTNPLFSDNSVNGSIKFRSIDKYVRGNMDLVSPFVKPGTTQEISIQNAETGNIFVQLKKGVTFRTLLELDSDATNQINIPIIINI